MEKDYVIAKTKELIEAPSCNPELKETANKFLESIDKENEKECTINYFKSLEENLSTIDELIDMLKSDFGQSIFGIEGAKTMLEQAQSNKEMGIKYCDCSACKLAEEILKYKDQMID